MITNEKQYRSTRAMVAGLRESLDGLVAGSDVHPIFIEAHRAALGSQIAELEVDLADYEALRAGTVSSFAAEGLHDLPEILIRARIARGMSQKELGDFLGLKEQQIQRYEAERYRSASLERLIEIADALHVRISNRGDLAGREDMADPASSSWSIFPFAEMYKRGWFDDFDGTLPQAKKVAPRLVADFFHGAHAVWEPAALHRRSVRSGGQVHEPALAAWEARVRILAHRHPPLTNFAPEAANEAWVEALVRLSGLADGASRVDGHLRSIGICLVIEPHLPGTLLDGAAMRAPAGYAIVGMTLRHDRWDNFWFTLLHEVAHLALHLRDLGDAIFDDTESPAASIIEDEADLFAQEALLSTAAWNSCVSRFTRTEKAVLADAKRLSISPAIIAGRIRREAGNYTLLRSLVGAGEPRRHLME